jgi:glucosamine kinase
MSNSKTYNIIGVDGGGTSCRIALILEGRRYEAKAGRANVTSDFSGAMRSISQGLIAVADMAGVSLQVLYELPIYLGLAGVLDDAVALQVEKALPFEHIQAADDRLSTLLGVLDGADGAVAGIGTGSFLASQRDATVRLIGGYGFQIGDEASGAWLGRALLSKTMHVLDGLHPPSALSSDVLSQLGGNAADIVRFASSATPGDFGRFAPQVVQAALAGDAIGLGLIQAGAKYITNALTAVGWSRSTPLCLTGGVGPQYAQFLPTDIAEKVATPKGTGLDGALILASRMAIKVRGAVS